MDSSLQFISTVGMSQQDWLKYRETGLGASEVGTVLGLNPYKASITLFYEKIGMLPVNQIENMAMFMGKQTEAFIADLWEYWEGDEESVIRNFYAQRKVRTCEVVPAYVRNPKYPWLFVSLDRLINSQKGGQEGALECKNMSYHASRVWESGIPPMYVTQVQTQIGVCKLGFGELAVLQDGRSFHSYEFEPSKGVFSTIADRTHDFWKRIVKGRKLFGQLVHARATFNGRLLEDVQGQIDELEPPADDTEAYREYMNMKYTDSKAGEVIGTTEDLDRAIKLLKVRDKIKKLDKDATLLENNLIKSIGEMEKLTFGDNGYVSWRPNNKGSRTFSNKVKPK